MVKLIKNGKVLNADGNGFSVRDLYIEDDKFIEHSNRIDETIDVCGRYVLPGMIDIHTHGANGVSFAEEMDFSPARKWFAEHGVTAFLPTITTLPVETLVRIEDNLTKIPERKSGESSLIGIHLEGPFISHIKRGAMIVRDDECNVENLNVLLKAGKGKVKIMTLAPERENATEVIEAGQKCGVRMSVGHTNATYAETKKGVEEGCTGATHLYNAMRGFEHRETGVLGAVLTDERVSCEIICDFVHSDSNAVLMAYRLKGKDNLIIISDTGNISGFPDGTYYELGRPVYVKDNQARNEDGNLCNSMLSVFEGAKNMLSLGVPLDAVAKMSSINPAKAIGLFEEYGSIDAGKYADFLICDEKLNLEAVYIGGKEVKR